MDQRAADQLLAIQNYLARSSRGYAQILVNRIVTRTEEIADDDQSAKFWLEPVGLTQNLGFSPKELRQLQKMVIQLRTSFLEDWHGHFGTEG